MKTRDEQFYRALIEHSSDAILVLGADLKVSFSAQQDLAVIGMPGVDPMGALLPDFASEECRDEMAKWLEQVTAHPEVVHRFEFEGRQRVKGGLHLVATATNLRSHPAVQGIVVSLRDVTKRKLVELETRQHAMYDGLTGLARRDFFAQQMRKAVARAARHQEILAVLFIDLDGFKAVNDALGHDAGDRLLKAVGTRLRDTLREDDTIGRAQLLENEDRIARRGGDEFTVMLTKMTEPANSGLVAQRMLIAVAAPYVMDGKEVVVTVSIGIAIFPQDGRSPEVLIKNADAAMYAAKKEGKNTYRFYSPA